MKKVIQSLFCIGILFSACQNAPKTTDAVTTTATPTTTVNASTTCYEMRIGRDITAIEMVWTGDEMSGYYAWEPYEKDSGRGSLKGKKEGDMVTAIFNYMIEGSIQSEEVVFKMVGDKLIQGRGELDDKTAVLMIKDKTKLTWGDTLSKVDCAVIKEPIARAQDMSALIAKQKGQ